MAVGRGFGVSDGLVPAGEVTGLLAIWTAGDRSALDRLLPLVERQLHLLAHRHLRRERPGHTLQTSVLVNEAYLRLVHQRQARWQNRAQFFGIAGQLMRRILIDHARKHAYAKRGGGSPRVPLDEACVISAERAADMVALDDALTTLAAVDERKSRIV